MFVNRRSQQEVSLQGLWQELLEEGRTSATSTECGGKEPQLKCWYCDYRAKYKQAL